MQLIIHTLHAIADALNNLHVQGITHSSLSGKLSSTPLPVILGQGLFSLKRLRSTADWVFWRLRGKFPVSELLSLAMRGDAEVLCCGDAAYRSLHPPEKQ